MKTHVLKQTGAWLLVALGVVVLDSATIKLHSVRTVFEKINAPIISVVHTPFRVYLNISEYIKTKNTLIADNERLNQQVAHLVSQLNQTHTLVEENQNLRALLGSSVDKGFEVHAANVIQYQMGDGPQYIWLGKGEENGIKVGQAVMDSEGIIGFVYKTEDLKSQVMLITDTQYSVPVLDKRSGLRTIVEGRGVGRLLEVLHLPENSDIKEGDVFLTSGIGALYPAGIPVARVESVTQSTADPFLHVKARPLASLDYLRQVLVIYDKP